MLFLMACKKALSQVYNFEIVICFLINRQLIVFKALLKERLMIEKSVFFLRNYILGGNSWVVTPWLFLQCCNTLVFYSVVTPWFFYSVVTPWFF